MSGLKFYCQIKFIIFALILSFVFPSPSWAYDVQYVYLITGGDIPKISAEIQAHIDKKKYNLYKKNEENGFFYYQPKFWGVNNDDYYVITAAKRINQYNYLYIQNNINANSERTRLLSHLKKNGLKYKKIKDDKLLGNLKHDANKLVYSYKFSDIYSEDSSKNIEAKEIVQQNKETVKQTFNKNSNNVENPDNSGREISKAGLLFNELKDGVVTIKTARYGTGFLVDERGLILTNYHGIKAVEEEDLRVRFGQNQVLLGKIVATDSKNNVAVLWVNLQNIKNYKIFKLASPKEGSPLVVVGEKVLTIGNLVDWKTMEKTLSQDVVSKYNNSVITHESNTDVGYGGSPLLNYNGKVVGITTFKYKNRTGLLASVPITKTYNVLNEAKAKISTMTMPSPDLMPDISPIPYSLEILEQAYYQSDSKTKKRDKSYMIETECGFTVYINTPPLFYRGFANKEEKKMKKFTKRQKKEGIQLTGEDYENKDMAYYFEYKPVVTVLVYPVPTFKFRYLDYTFDKDFKKLELFNKNIGKSLVPYSGGKKIVSDKDLNFTDKTYSGLYEYDPKYFLTGDELEFKIYYSNNDPPITVKIDDELKEHIIQDFKPYWDFCGRHKNQ